MSEELDSNYIKFLSGKAAKVKNRGLSEPPPLAPHLFPFQRDSVEFCLKVGTSGLFLDTGLGKTECQLEWCLHAQNATNGRSLILTPLAVAGQTKRRAERWGYEAKIIREQSEAFDGINICNYDRLDKLDPDFFGAVSLDEASILKSLTGKTTQALITAFRGHRFKLVATATPAPNDHMELGNYAEFLEIMAANEMLSRWFINDTSSASQNWRLKGHAKADFWNWMASWSRMAEKPSDLGDVDDGYNIPPFDLIKHRAKDSNIDNRLADLFGGVNMSATSIHEVKRQTIDARSELAAKLIAEEPDETWILWCDSNYEADALRAAIPDAVEVRGSQTTEEKECKISAFADGDIKYIIGKPSMLGFGLDWAHCARMAFVGRSYSYEAWYQAVRRCWRYGQKRTLKVHLIIAEGESEIGRIVDRKSDDHRSMKIAMRDAMRNSADDNSKTSVIYEPKHKGQLPSWI